MQIIRYTTRYRSEIEALLSLCFGMTARESRVMLDDAVANGDCLMLLSEDKPVSVALTKRVVLRFAGADCIGAYIFGLCTAPEHRGRGYASSLIREACDSAGADFALLIPETPDLFDFYEALGFLPVGEGAAFTVAAGEYESVSVLNGAEAYAAYAKAASECGDICALSESDLAASAAIAPRVCVAGESGVCFVSADGAEAFAPRESVRALAASALALCGVGSARVTAPPSCAPEDAEPVRIGLIKPLSGAPVPKSFYVNNLYNL